VDLPSLRAIELSPTGGNDQLNISVGRLRFELWKAGRIEVGRGFRNANHGILIVGDPIRL